MGVNHRLCPLAVAIPGAVDVVGHEVQVVDVF